MWTEDTLSMQYCTSLCVIMHVYDCAPYAFDDLCKMIWDAARKTMKKKFFVFIIRARVVSISYYSDHFKRFSLDKKKPNFDILFIFHLQTLKHYIQGKKDATRMLRTMSLLFDRRNYNLKACPSTQKHFLLGMLLHALFIAHYTFERVQYIVENV